MLIQQRTGLPAGASDVRIIGQSTSRPLFKNPFISLPCGIPKVFCLEVFGQKNSDVSRIFGWSATGFPEHIPVWYFKFFDHALPFAPLKIGTSPARQGKRVFTIGN